MTCLRCFRRKPNRFRNRSSHTPSSLTNHSGADWQEGKKDAKGNAIPLAHPNARYTIRMEYLDNLDPAWDDKDGVVVQGIIYGGRDRDTSVPVEESRGWVEGIVLKACTLESETTAATLGKAGALETPTGLIPLYEDLQRLFLEFFGEAYTREEYDYQFSFRCEAWLAKLERAVDFYRKNVPALSERCFRMWQEAIDTIRAAQKTHGAVILPGTYRPR